ncbi:hypothetical protein, partial [Staphylococcus epidermidis]|uniref:hypothetical protein n=1 Tax=Staphylococcus epidermidis TaxID=1282 RepID=UPI0030BEB176
IMTKLFGVYKPMSKISFNNKKRLNPLLTRDKALIQKLSYFYIISRQEETRFKKAKKSHR